jgi:hypothetical protein
MVQNKIDLGTRTKEVPSDPKHGKKVKMGRRLPKKLQPAAKNDSLLTCDDCKHNCITYEPSRDGFCNCGCHQ